MTVDGVTIRPGEKISFDAGLNNFLNDISYLADATRWKVLGAGQDQGS